MGRPRKTNLLTVSERETMTASIESDQNFKDQVTGKDLPPGIFGPVAEAGANQVDLNALDASIRHKKRILAEGTPERLSGPKRLEAEKRYKELGEALTERLLTHKEMDLMPKDGYGYSRAVRKSTAQEVGNPQTQAMAVEWKNLGAQLDPDNPEAQSLESLRKAT